jgi:hypothetical protein
MLIDSEPRGMLTAVGPCSCALPLTTRRCLPRPALNRKTSSLPSTAILTMYKGRPYSTGLEEGPRLLSRFTVILCIG